MGILSKATHRNVPAMRRSFNKSFPLFFPYEGNFIRENMVQNNTIKFLK